MHLCVGDILAAEFQVAVNGAAEQHTLLGHIAQQVVQLCLWHLAHVNAVHGHLAAGHGDRDGHFTQATLRRGSVAAIGQGCGVVGGGYGAGVVDIQVQHNAHQHGGCQHEQDVTGHFCGHGMVSSPCG